MIKVINIPEKGRGIDNKVTCIAISPDDLTAAVSSSTGSVRLWSLSTGACLRYIETGVTYFSFMTFNPAGSLLTTAGGYGVINQWLVDGASTAPTRTFRGLCGRLSSVVYTTPIQLVIGSSRGALQVWDVGGPASSVASPLMGPPPPLCLVAHTKDVRGLSLSADGSVLVSASDDHTLKRWRRRGSEWECTHNLTGHTDLVTCVAVSPGGDLAVSSSWDYSVQVWDLKTGTCKKVLKHDSLVHTVALSRDCRVAISRSVMTVNLWRLYE